MGMYLILIFPSLRKLSSHRKAFWQQRTGNGSCLWAQRLCTSIQYLMFIYANLCRGCGFPLANEHMNMWHNYILLHCFLWGRGGVGIMRGNFYGRSVRRNERLTIIVYSIWLLSRFRVFSNRSFNERALRFAWARQWPTKWCNNNNSEFCERGTSVSVTVECCFSQNIFE